MDLFGSNRNVSNKIIFEKDMWEIQKKKGCEFEFYSLYKKIIKP